MNMTRSLIRLGRRLGAAAAEAHRARTRLVSLMLAPDRHLLAPGAAPEHYAEFLLRTSGPLPREPSAAQRQRSRCARP